MPGQFTSSQNEIDFLLLLESKCPRTIFWSASWELLFFAESSSAIGLSESARIRCQ
jgi:hypothetical protein